MPSFAYAARYVYTDTVIQNDNLLRVSAYNDVYQTSLMSAVTTEPRSALMQFIDSFGNSTHHVRLVSPHDEFIILSVGTVRMRTPPVPDDLSLECSEYDSDAARRFLVESPLVSPSRVVDAAREIVGNRAGLLEAVGAVVDWIYANIEYERGWTTVATPAERILETRRGVCQDMTHLAIAMLRSLGIPARYTSGLLVTQPGETHAWVEYLHPLHGWIAADPTRGQRLSSEGDLIKFAIGPDYTHASPVEGTFRSRGTGQLDVAVGQLLPYDRPPSLEDARNLIQGPGRAQTFWP
jgi:transglutaminase-like putative cysteine protease